MATQPLPSIESGWASALAGADSAKNAPAAISAFSTMFLINIPVHPFQPSVRLGSPLWRGLVANV